MENQLIFHVNESQNVINYHNHKCRPLMRAASLIMRLSILLHIVPYGKVERHTTGVVCSFRMIYSQYVQIHLTIVLKKSQHIKITAIAVIFILSCRLRRAERPPTFYSAG